MSGLAIDRRGRWASLSSTLVSVVVVGLLIAALFKVGRSAPFWSGFALAGWAALLLGWIGSERGTWLLVRLDDWLTPPGERSGCLTCQLEIAGDTFRFLWGGAVVACAAAGGWGAKCFERAKGRRLAGSVVAPQE
ncbi:MAG: hypothetical protein U0836_12875 [Pirellulales bacterium]